ncbi:hypothetical protein KUCAC02_002934 [Chaenocephalus aceratus]|uniref:Uncharacterized protein n=1 Tax=Chaenocephalus aceratus TaxID=36190 RepID=A0ACB9WKR6_CHAAC|nr:hypothetical protein KUCAC02_002934 [Chaenocephalus aceratus]
MPEDKHCKLLQPSRSCDTKQKTKRNKKKRKQVTTSSTPPGNTETPHAASLPPETSPVSQPPPTESGGELSAQAKESLRWEGELEDPQDEEKRLQLYRANRRQRYITHRDALIKQTALRKTFPK